VNDTADIARLRAVLDVHGADDSRWPAGDRAALSTLIARSQEARAVFDDAVRLDRVLDDDTLPAPAAALRRAILARVPQPRRTLAEALGDFWAALGGGRVAAPAFAVAFVVGTALGIYADPATQSGNDVEIDLVEVAQLATEYPEL
jgi:ferric-dicitrate binding protein FerR (iron transport regulator)